MIKFLGTEEPTKGIVTIWFEGIKIDLNRNQARKLLEDLHKIFVKEVIEYDNKNKPSD